MGITDNLAPFTEGPRIDPFDDLREVAEAAQAVYDLLVENATNGRGTRRWIRARQRLGDALAKLDHKREQG